jgi:hypothetical protein
MLSLPLTFVVFPETGPVELSIKATKSCLALSKDL